MASRANAQKRFSLRGDEFIAVALHHWHVHFQSFDWPISWMKASTKDGFCQTEQKSARGAPVHWHYKRHPMNYSRCKKMMLSSSSVWMQCYENSSGFETRSALYPLFFSEPVKPSCKFVSFIHVLCACNVTNNPKLLGFHCVRRQKWQNSWKLFMTHVCFIRGGCMHSHTRSLVCCLSLNLNNGKKYFETIFFFIRWVVYVLFGTLVLFIAVFYASGCVAFCYLLLIFIRSYVLALQQIIKHFGYENAAYRR